MHNFNVQFKINGLEHSVFPGLHKTIDLFNIAGINTCSHQLYLNIDDQIDIPLKDTDSVLIKGDEKFVVTDKDEDYPDNPKLDVNHSVSINGQLFKEGFEELMFSKVTGQQLFDLAGISSDEHRLILDLQNLADELISPEDVIVIGKDWSFISTPMSPVDDVVDIEDCPDRGNGPAHRYKIRIDQEKYIVDKPHITGHELYALSNKSPDTDKLWQKLHGGGTKPIKPETKVDLSQPGIERFNTTPCDMREGLELRRQFQLPSRDLEYLESLNLEWETVIENNIRRLVMYQFPIHEGFRIKQVTVNLRIEASYPDCQIDMAYFYPPIERLDGKSIAATIPDNFDGKAWQRWSRHRSPSNPWRMGVDDVSTHINSMDSWFINELKK